MLLWLNTIVASRPLLPSPNKLPAVLTTPSTAKQPHLCLDVHDIKAPAALPTVSWMSWYPSWRITHLELVDPFGWHEIDAATLRLIQQKLRAFETMTLDAIWIKAKKQNHGVQLHKLSLVAQKRIKVLGYDADLEQIYSLRLSNKERIWGIRECNVFQLLWWDPQHQVCPSIK